MTDRPEGKMCVRVDAYTRVCLSVIAVLLTVIVIGLWAETPRIAADAAAKGPSAKSPKVFLDSSAQRKAQIEELQKTNQKLTELVSMLRNGQAKVQIVAAPQAPAKNAEVPKQ